MIAVECMNPSDISRGLSLGSSTRTTLWQLAGTRSQVSTTTFRAFVGFHGRNMVPPTAVTQGPRSMEKRQYKAIVHGSFPIQLFEGPG